MDPIHYPTTMLDVKIFNSNPIQVVLLYFSVESKIDIYIVESILDSTKISKAKLGLDLN